MRTYYTATIQAVDRVFTIHDVLGLFFGFYLRRTREPWCTRDRGVQTRKKYKNSSMIIIII